jgi:hypothetical protein
MKALYPAAEHASIPVGEDVTAFDFQRGDHPRGTRWLIMALYIISGVHLLVFLLGTAMLDNEEKEENHIAEVAATREGAVKVALTMRWRRS